MLSGGSKWGIVVVEIKAGVPATLTLANHDTGQTADKFTTTTPVTNVLYALKLTRSGTVTVDTLRVNFTIGGGVANGDVTAGELWLDANNDGVINGGDSSIQTGITPVVGVLTFTTNFTPGTSGTNYLVQATVANLAGNDTTTFSVGTADIDEVEGGVVESGSITNAVHTQEATLTLANHDTGQTADKFTTTTPVTDGLFTFKLTRSGTVNVDTLRVNFTTGSGVANGDVTAGELWLDANNDGVINGGDSAIQTGITPLGGVLTFTTNFQPSTSGTNYLVRATVTNLVGDDTTTFTLGTTDIVLVEAGVQQAGSTTGATHTQDKTLTLADHDAGQTTDKFVSATPVTDVLFAFKLTPSGTVTIDTIWVNFTNATGVSDGDVSSSELWLDANNDGVINGGDSMVQAGAVGGGLITFGTNFVPPGGGANYLVRATVANLVGGDTTTFSLTMADIDEVEAFVTESGSTTGVVHTHDGPAGLRDVYYSVGTSGADLTTGAPTISISGGTATLSVAQTGNMGVGDVIDYGPGNKVYIQSVTSQTVFQVRTVTGTMPPNTGAVAVNDIRRVFASFSSAVTNSGGASYLTTFDLAANDVKLTWVAYDTGPINEAGDVIIDGYTTDATRRITATAASATQVASGTSQRHQGTAGSGARIVSSGTNNVVLIQDDFVTLEFLELDGGGNSLLQVVRFQASDLTLRNSILHAIDRSAAVNGVLVSNGTGHRIYNNFIYDIHSSDGGAADTHGIQVTTGAANTIEIYNNSILDVRIANAVSTGDAYGILTPDDATKSVVNNIVMNTATAGSGTAADFQLTAPGAATYEYNMSSDTSATGTGSLASRLATDQYVSVIAGTENLHLKAGSAALSTGIDLSGSFTDDIDGDSRPLGGGWDMGADESALAGASLSLGDHDAGQTADKFTTVTPETDVLFGFKLTRSGVVTVDTLRVNFTTGGGVANGDVSAGELWLDADNDGVIGGGDTSLQIGVTPVAGVLTFTTNFSPTAVGTNYLIRATVSNLVGGDTTTLSVGTAEIDEVEAGVVESGAITNAVHTFDATLVLGDHDAGQTADKFTTTTPETDVLFAFKLTPAGTVTIDNLRVNFTSSGGVVDGDVTAGELWADNNNDGIINGGDLQLQSGVVAAGGVLTFTNNFSPGGGGTNYLLRATVANLYASDTSTFSLGLADIDEIEAGVVESGASSNAVHTFDCPFSCRKVVTIDHTQVGLDNVGSISDYPLLVNIQNDDDLKTVGNGGKIQDANGFDIVFFDSDGVTRLDHEIEQYDGVNGSLVAWVRIPTLSKAADTVIYLDLGNSCISTSQENVNNVWDANFEAVWHLVEDPSGAPDQMGDSTSNGFDGAATDMTLANQVPGKIGGSLDFEESDNADIVKISSNPAALKFGSGQITISMWYKPESIPGAPTRSLFSTFNHTMAGCGAPSNVGIRFAQLSTGEVWLGLTGASAASTTQILPGPNWFHLVGTYDGADIRFYVNGVLEDTQPGNSPGVHPTLLPALGGADCYGSSGQDGTFIDGLLDEVRASSTARSPDFIRTSYNNQNSPSTFYTVTPNVTLADHDAGQVSDKFTTTAGLTDVLFRFKLTRAGTATIDNVRVGFTTGGGVANGDVSNAELWEDGDNDGVVSGGDTLIHGAVAPSGGVLTFTNDFVPSAAGTEYLLRATVSNLVGGDTTTFSLDTAGLDELECMSELGSATGAVHTQDTTLTLADHDLGQVPDRFTTTTPVTDILFGFKLTRDGTATMDNVRVQYTTGGGVVDADVNAGELWEDVNGDGAIGGPDIQHQSGVAGSAGQLLFDNDFTPSAAGTNYLVRVTVANLVATDTTTFTLGLSDIDEVEGGVVESGSTTGALHTQDSTLTLADHDAGQTADKFAAATPVIDVLFGFKLTRVGNLNVDVVRVNFTTGGGVANGDVTSGELWFDVDNDGAIGGPDTSIQIGVTPVTGVLTFTNNFVPTGVGSNLLVRATVANLVAGDTTTFSLGLADIDEVEVGIVESGSTTPAVHFQDASLADVYYSAGTAGASDLKNGAPSVTITAGTVTFTLPQADNIGLGDEITYNGTTKAYISGRTSSTVYTVTTKTGTVPVNAGPVLVDSITRAFDSLTNAITGSSDGNHLGTNDLVVGNFRLHWVLYDDGPLVEAPDIDGWTTGPNNYLQVFTPVTSSEVGVSQRHNGVEGTGVVFRPSNGAPPTFYNLFTIREEYTRVEGIELDGNNVTGGEQVRGLHIFNSGGMSPSDVRIDGVIVHDLINMVNSPNADAWGLYNQSADLIKVSNSIFYDIENQSTDPSSEPVGIRIDGAGATAYVYNNTVYDIHNTGSTRDARGIYVRSPVATAVVRNNYAGRAITDSGLEFDFLLLATTVTADHNVSSDDTADDNGGVGNVINQSSYGTYFQSVTPGSENLHLRADSNALWGTYGLDLDSDANLPVTQDIDGDARDGTNPDVGADEFDLAINIGDVYYSVGTNGANLRTGTPSLQIVGGVATLDIAQTGNVGVGDCIDYDIDNKKVYIQRVVSQTQFIVTTVTGGLPANIGTVALNAINRTFTSLTTAEANSGTGAYLGTFDLTSGGGASLHWVLYNDGAFNITTDFEIDGYTTNAANNLTLTVARADQVASGVAQHHDGTAGSGARLVAAANLTDLLRISDHNVLVELLEIDGGSGAGRDVWVGVHANGTVDGITIRDLVVHDVSNNGPASGIATDGCGASSPCYIYNNFVFDIESTFAFAAPNGPVSGIGDGLGAAGSEVYIYNNSVFKIAQNGGGSSGSDAAGISAFSAADRTIQNNIVIDVVVTGSGVAQDYCVYTGSPPVVLCHAAPPAVATFDYNMSSDTSAASTNGITGEDTGEFVSTVDGAENLHLAPTADAVNKGLDLSAILVHDIDLAIRQLAWDMGADDLAAATAVELVGFEALASNGAVELYWETGSEIRNLGFHLYRATAPDGAYQRITERPIPGLGNSPVGARYSYRDQGLANGITYYYQLEDIETTGATELHGPVSARPTAAAGDGGVEERRETGDDGDGSESRITYGDPSQNELKLLHRGRRGIVVELITQGFYAEPQADGTVLLGIPGFELTTEPGSPAMPMKRHWVEALAGRRVEVASVQSREVERVTGGWLINGEVPELVASTSGTVRARRRQRRTRLEKDGLFPAESARVAMVAFQGDVKKAMLEMAPLRWDGATRDLVLARRLVVTLSFERADEREITDDGIRGRRRRRAEVSKTTRALVRLATTEPGLHRVRFEELLGANHESVSADSLRLSRQGETVAFHLEPNGGSFRPGSLLYFLSEGPDANPYGQEAVYELELNVAGEGLMSERRASPSSPAVTRYWKQMRFEENRFYQAALVEAPDIWLWELLLAPVTKSFPFPVSDLAPASEPAALEVWLQGTSDLPEDPDHHLRVYVNGTFLSEASWDGKEPRHLTMEVPPGVLAEGENQLELESVGDTGAAYSTLMLSRFSVSYPRRLIAQEGRLEGGFTESGTAQVSGLAGVSWALDVTDRSKPEWLTGTEAAAGSLSFFAQASRRYLVVSDALVLRPEVRPSAPSSLRSRSRQVDYLVIAPKAFLAAAAPLLSQRKSQGLSTMAVATEEIFSEFGHGEATPESIQQFLAYAYHEWPAPSLRYVVLLGDASYDFKNYTGSGVVNQVPPLMVRTSYLWTVSDPSLAAVNGDDLLPDLAIGRLPAASVEEVTTIVDKILAYESSERTVVGPTVLVADNADKGGNFEADAEAVARKLPSGVELRRLYLGELGTAATRDGIAEAFDQGASLVSYIGHGGIHLWGDENLFNSSQVSTLAPQAQQPFLLTMNCLNGYFHFPFFSSLSEELLTADGKGVIAAFSPSGLSLNQPAQKFHLALLDEIFSGKHERLGDAVLAAQGSYLETGALPELVSIYHLLGDPALKLR